jgi:two-component system OmpR family response regulator/two-component system alkaline phosphatase synthesis response regulator PhoP
MPTPRVLVVEDEAHIRELVCLHLGLEGYECVQAADCRQALDAAADQKLDLIVLDLMIPVIDGMTVCRSVRREGPNRDVPILMLTARREEADKVLGLESGADDYLTKPFGVRELVARCHALLRRMQRSQQEGAAEAAPARATQPLTVHGVEIDPAKRRVRLHDRDIDLTNQEFTLLLLFAEHPGIVFSREALLEKIWRGDTFVTERSVDTLVKRLRHKVEDDPANPVLILTQWGVGYKFADV